MKNRKFKKRVKGTEGTGDATKAQASDLKFAPHGEGENRQRKSYAKVKLAIEKKVQKEYENSQDLVAGLRALRRFDIDGEKPTMVRSVLDDKEARAAENQANAMAHATLMAKWEERKQKLKFNKSRAYALIMD